MKLRQFPAPAVLEQNTPPPVKAPAPSSQTVFPEKR